VQVPGEGFRYFPVVKAFLFLVLLIAPLAFVSSAFAVTTHQPANLVIGQSSFTASTCVSNPSTQTGLCLPGSTAFDKFGNLWASDTGNNRVLRFDAPPTTHESASLVIGQSTFTTFASATSQSGLSTPSGIAFDSSGNLWVADRSNSRVLKFNAPFTSGEPASLVIGQSTFTTFASATSQSGLNYPQGIAFDSSGNLWVADQGNSRVLKFSAPFSTGEIASLVIGQSTFTAKSCATTQSGLCLPYGIAFDSSGNLWVADQGNSRVLKYSAPFSNGKPASLVIGQSTFTTATSATSQSGLSTPFGIAFDSSSHLWVADESNSRVLKFT
jgi:sugar lactone lactonase YvrE